ncbi:MAG TPA: extracellular solute-binding protein [Candidatus Mediterraneibacter excrementigallinarum]|nr:extracellular solute-binding protein [Candidatus Mediterraneibacter excrementigallinarum]
MKKKRVLAVVMAVTMLAGMATGCSSAGGEDKGSSSGKIELEFFTQKREASETFDKIVEEFNNSQDEIIVTQNIVPDATSVLMSRAATGDLPDIIQVGGMQDSNTMQFMKEGHFLELTDMECLDNVVDEYKDAITFQGKNYVVPISANFSGVFYNKDMFEEAGYEVPTTYDELIDLAKDIQSKGEVPFLFPDKDAWTIVQCWEDNIDGSARGDRSQVYADIANGATTFEDDALFPETLQKVIDIRQYGQGDTLSLGYDQAISDFATGKSYMFMQGVWALPSIKSANPDMNIGMFSFPSNDGDTKVSMGIDVNLAISADCENADAAKEFVEFAASKEMVQLYVDNDYSVPCMKDVTANIPEAEMIVNMINEGKGALQSTALPKAVADERQNTIQKVLVPAEDGGEDISTFLENLTKVFQENKDEFLELYGE